VGSIDISLVSACFAFLFLAKSSWGVPSWALSEDKKLKIGDAAPVVTALNQDGVKTTISYKAAYAELGFSGQRPKNSLVGPLGLNQRAD
jgi:hypothetical protein